MRAAIATLSSKEKRATAYGFFNMVYGIAWFVGSSIFGILYTVSLPWAVGFSVIIQLSALPFFALSGRSRQKV
jgi:MFS family permease